MATSLNYDDYNFTPTEELILEVLTARVRLGNNVWTMSNRNKQAFEKLVAKDLIEYKSASVEGHVLVWLTETGEKLLFKNKYNSPVKFSELKDLQKKLRKNANS
jgi:hypothetical protein